VSVTEMNDEFCEFIDHSRRWSNPPTDIFAPAFFVENAGDLSNIDADPEAVAESPFPVHWLVTRWHLVQNGATMIFKCFEDSDGDQAFALYARAPSRKWGTCNFSKQSSQAIQHQELMIDGCWTQIAHRAREVVLSERLVGINRGRAKSKRSIPPIPAFINLRAPLRIGGEDNGRRGLTMRPHERIGHKRRLKKPTRDGRSEVWVRSCSIHGGSPVPQNYVV
jgi:hypothetical protein